jgi:hypothetical protein
MYDNLQGYVYEARRTLCSTCSFEDIAAKVSAINRAVISMAVVLPVFVLFIL